MNNIFCYTDYLNEGLFSSRYSDILKKLRKICNEINPNAIRIGYDKITIFHKISQIDPVNDPYQEEVYEEQDIKIQVKRDFTMALTRNYDYKVYVNDDLIELKNYQARELYNLLETRHENQKKKEKEERVRQTLQKF